MINLAGNKDCDIAIKKELQEAGIDQVYYERPNEVPTKIEGRFMHYKFHRAWIYWIVSGFTSYRISELLYNKSKELKPGKYGYPIRVMGHCKCPEPGGSVDYWHIDTQEGLNEFIKIISENR